MHAYSKYVFSPSPEELKEIANRPEFCSKPTSRIYCQNAIHPYTEKQIESENPNRKLLDYEWIPSFQYRTKNVEKLNWVKKWKKKRKVSKGENIDKKS